MQRTRKDKLFDENAVQAICETTLRDGKIPTLEIIRNAGCRGDIRSLCAVLRNFKETNKTEIKRLRAESAETLADRGSLTQAMKYWRSKAENLEKEVKELKARLSLVELKN